MMVVIIDLRPRNSWELHVYAVTLDSTPCINLEGHGGRRPEFVVSFFWWLRRVFHPACLKTCTKIPLRLEVWVNNIISVYSSVFMHLKSVRFPLSLWWLLDACIPLPEFQLLGKSPRTRYHSTDNVDAVHVEEGGAGHSVQGYQQRREAAALRKGGFIDTEFGTYLALAVSIYVLFSYQVSWLRELMLMLPDFHICFNL